MEFHDQSLRFTNKFYFQVKNDENDTATAILIILFFLSVIPLSLVLCISNIVLIYLNLIYSLIRYIKGSDKMSKKIKEVMSSPSLLIVSILVNASLLAFHIFAAKENFYYLHDIFNSSGIGIVLLVQAFFSIISIACMCIASYLHFKHWKHQENKVLLLHFILAVSIMLNIVYLGSFFGPYMLLAFIHDPLQAMFFYLVVAMVIIGAYFLCTPFVRLFQEGKCQKDYRTPIIFYVVLSLGASIIFFVIVMAYILTLGSFSDFNEVQNLLIPLLVAMFAAFILKPSKQVLTQNVKDDSATATNQDVQISVQSNDDVTNQNEENNTETV